MDERAPLEFALSPLEFKRSLGNTTTLCILGTLAIAILELTIGRFAVSDFQMGCRMTMVGGNQLRSIQEGDVAPPMSEISGEDFSLTPREVKFYLSTGAPVILYDIVEPDTRVRIGIASLVLEHDPATVQTVGNVCANLAKQRGDRMVLQRVALALLEECYRRGIDSPTIVVPDSELEALQTCRALGPTGCELITIDERRHSVFRYWAPRLAGT